MEERLQKILSGAGLCSRREAETWIQAGRVRVNGQQASLGDKADLDTDLVEVDGKALHPQGERHYLMLYKPRGYVSTLSDEQGRRTVADLLGDYPHRLWPVGRLDLNSEGLLLMTDDGAMTHSLLHPSHQVEKEYLVWVTGELEQGLGILSAPMELEGETLAPVKVKYLSEKEGVARLSITLTQGKNRQIRRMCGKAGLSVKRLKRIREGNIPLDPGLKPGQWRLLQTEERNSLVK